MREKRRDKCITRAFCIPMFRCSCSNFHIHTSSTELHGDFSLQNLNHTQQNIVLQLRTYLKTSQLFMSRQLSILTHFQWIVHLVYRRRYLTPMHAKHALNESHHRPHRLKNGKILNPLSPKRGMQCRLSIYLLRTDCSLYSESTRATPCRRSNDVDRDNDNDRNSCRQRPVSRDDAAPRLCRSLSCCDWCHDEPRAASWCQPATNGCAVSDCSLACLDRALQNEPTAEHNIIFIRSPC